MSVKSRQEIVPIVLPTPSGLGYKVTDGSNMQFPEGYGDRRVNNMKSPLVPLLREQGPDVWS